jgi:2-polyprenyl-3-methyl-5-hydroxy-6-metoxy-1,4-benzoquinol methylase
MSLTQTERAKYELLAAVPQYAEFSPAERYLPVFLELVGDSRGTVLDAGCCTGKGGVLLKAHGFDVTLCDLTDSHLVDGAKALPFVSACLWHEVDSFTHDYVIACDVLEHIAIEYTMLVVRNLLAIAKRGLFLSIALQPDQFGVMVGEHLHQTVQAFPWWKARIGELGDIVDARDLLNVGLYYVRPR